MTDIHAIAVGLEHSCTRVLTGLLNLHPQIKCVHHISYPSANKFFALLDLISWIKKDFGEVKVKVVLMVRDSNAIEQSQRTEGSMKRCLVNIGILNDDIITEANKILIAEIYTLFADNKFTLNDFGIISIESLYQYRELSLKKLFYSLGLSVDNYDYYSKEIFDLVWSKVNLEITNVNKKYYKE